MTAILYAAAVLAAVRGPKELFILLLAAMGVAASVELKRLAGRAGAAALLELVVVAAGLLSLLYLRYADAPRPIGCGIDCMWGPVLMTIVAVWAGDVVAYLVGSSVGRRKIVPRISPGKTWEGTIAGVVAAGIVVILWSRPELGPPGWTMLIAVLIGVVAFAGDILESWVKRRAGVKDSGTLFPGHGGMLDRIDSLVAASTLVALVVVAVRRMG
ncbi:MAG: phosphatidate cytidylyltransferase [Chloroflexota bacterium]|nr:phosphatidate cytidylyltransferase [Chloroflexota bacterium]